MAATALRRLLPCDPLTGLHGTTRLDGQARQRTGAGHVSLEFCCLPGDVGCCVSPLPPSRRWPWFLQLGASQQVV